MKNTKVCIYVAWLALMALCAVGCSGKKTDTTISSSLPEEVSEQIQWVNKGLEDLDFVYHHFSSTQDPNDLLKLKTIMEDLSFEYDDEDLTPEDLRFCRQLTIRMDSALALARHLIEQKFQMLHTSLVSEHDHLIDQMVEYPLYLGKGSTLFLDISSQGSLTARLYNADSRQLIKTYSGSKAVADSIPILNSAVYLLEIVPKGSIYVDMDIKQGVGSIDMLGQTKDIKTEEIEASASDFRAQKINGIQMKPVFEEPRKVTLRSQGKAFFSGSSRSVVAISIPRGASDLLYSLRISTNEGDKSTDGEFCKEMNSSYKKIRFLGLPIYESQGNKSSLIRELLNANVPPREEEAYCNMYVFTSQDQAKKFQDGVPVADLKYNIDLSMIGTQSCNGRIPASGRSTIYLGFENERFRYSNYLWLEVISSVPKTEYVRKKYIVE